MSPPQDNLPPDGPDSEPPEAGGPHAEAEEQTEPFEGAAVLDGTSQEVLVRLAQDDPLGVDGIAFEHLLAGALLMDCDSVTLRTMAYMAYEAEAYAGDPPLREWIQDCVERAVRALLNEEWEAERIGPPDEPFEERHKMLAEVLGKPPIRGRRLTNWLNSLPKRLRHPFFHVHLMGDDPSVYASQARTVVEDVESRLAEALGDLAQYSEHDPGYQVHDLEDPSQEDSE